MGIVTSPDPGVPPTVHFNLRRLRSSSRHPPFSTMVRRSVCRDVRVANTNGERCLSTQAMFTAPALVDDVPLATTSSVADTCPRPAVSYAAPVAVTLAKTSHMRRTGASHWTHRASACSTLDNSFEYSMSSSTVASIELLDQRIPQLAGNQQR